MKILTQEGLIVNDDKVLKYDVYQTPMPTRFKVEAVLVNGEEIILGFYKTDKRAKEVLELLLEFYRSGIMVFTMPKE
jgi:hypothetical protein